ncbi:MAG: hypothetical protein Q8Q35_04225 [Nanoarchaeota archaeon]|nr:hypothetical protein [Nanoarchaeota archaeon]
MADDNLDYRVRIGIVTSVNGLSIGHRHWDESNAPFDMNGP